MMPTFEEAVSSSVEKARLMLWDIIEELDPESFSLEEARDIFVSQAKSWGKKTSKIGSFYDQADLAMLIEEGLVEPDDESFQEGRFRVTFEGHAFYEQMNREIMEEGVYT